MNQQDNKKKFNPDNIPPKGDDPKSRKPRFSIYWVYGVVFLTIIAWNLFRTVNSAGIETDQQKFYAMVLQGDVEKIQTIRNKEIVRVFLNPDSLKNKAGFYKPLLNIKPDDKNYETAIVVKPEQPQLFFNIVDDKTFALFIKDNTYKSYLFSLRNGKDITKQHWNNLKPEYNITLIVERNILSKESRILQSETRKRKIKSGEIKLFEKIIYQYDLEGNFLEKYESIKKACIINNIHQSTICRFLNKTYKKGGNYLWSLEYKEKLEPYIKIRNDMGKLNKAVQILENNIVVLEFNSFKECAKYFNTYSTCISYAIKINAVFRNKYKIILKPA